MLVEITLNDGSKTQTFVEDYNAKEIVADLTNESLNYIAIGDVIVQRYAVISIKPVQQAPTE